MKINSNGSIDPTPVMITALKNDGSFSFDNLSNQDITDMQGEFLNHMISISICDTTLSRPLTGQEEQNISAGASLLEKIEGLGSLAPKTLSQLKIKDLESLVPVLNSIAGNDLETAYLALIADPDLKLKFTLATDLDPEDLKFSSPSMTSYDAPLTPLEATTNSYTVSPKHWFSGFVPAYEWSLDSVIASTAATYNYVPSKDSQGAHVLILRVGHDNAGTIDPAKPVFSRTFNLTTQNNFPAVAPAISVVGSFYRNSTALMLEMTTGASLAECKSFTKLALVEGVVPPLLDSAYDITCTDDGTQTLNFTLSADNGAHSLTLWAKDSSGNISAADVSNSVQVILDTVSPSLAISPLAAALRGGQAVSIIYTASDVTAGLDEVKLLYAEDGVTFSTELQSGAGEASPYAWTVPSDDTLSAKIKLQAKDKAGNTREVFTDAFTVDSVVPTAPSLTLLNGAFSKIRDIDLTVTPPVDCFKIYYSDSASAPTLATAGWENCAAAKTFQVTAGDGLKNIYAWVRDEAGNIGPQGTAAVTLDQTNPTLTLTAPNGGYYKAGQPMNFTWVASDTNIAASPIQIEISEDDGVNWVELVATHANTGTYAWMAPAATDKAGYKVRLSATDQAGNKTVRVSTTGFTVDSIAPVISSIILNDGDTFAGTASIGAKIAVTDNMPGEIKVRTAEANNITQSCQTQYADDLWVPWTNAQTSMSHFIPPVDGVKKICVWAKDAAGNVTVISPAAGTDGVTYDEIKYERGNPPLVTMFTATKNGSNTDFVIAGSDVEGFPTSGSYTIAYSTDNSIWLDIGTGLDITSPENMTWYGDSSGSWTKTHVGAPSAVAQYRVMLKDAAGNTSLVTKSSFINAAGWSVFAGTRDSGNGGSGASVRWYMATKTQSFAVHPKTNDIYFVDEIYGVRKYNVKTGITSSYIRTGTTNLAASGTLDSTVRLGVASHRIAFDKDGFLYIQVAEGSSQKIYRFDTSTGAYKFYAGGGAVASNANPTPATLFVYHTSFTFDEDNSLYIMSSCDPSALGYGFQSRQMLKITQNSTTKDANAVQVIAGDCSAGHSITIGASATQTPIYSAYPQLSSFQVFERGRYIYYHEYNGLITYKMTDGVFSKFDTGCRTLFYNKVTNKILCANTTTLYQATPTLSATPETLSPITNVSLGSSCWDDGILASESCPQMDNGLAADSSGNILLVDGTTENKPRFNRLRAITSDGKISTLFGTRSFSNGNNTQSKELISASFRGIHYKKFTDLNQAAFPEGLYFTDATAMVFGRVNPDGSNLVLQGNQLEATPANDSAMSPTAGMGAPFQNYYNAPLYFDNQGLPWLKIFGILYQINETKTLKVRSSPISSGALWSRQDEGSDPTKIGMLNWAATNNLVGHDTSFFFAGTSQYSSTSPELVANEIAKILYLHIDLTTPSNNVTKRVMGKTLVSLNPTPAPDFPTTVAGDVKNQDMDSTCGISPTTCFTYYDKPTDRLYYSEKTKIRYITTATNPATSTLNTLFTSIVGTVRNFTMTPDGSKIWFATSAGGLYCLKITSSESWCNGTTNYNSISTFASISPFSNQFTWKDDNTLYISNNSIILEFHPPTGP